MRDRKIAYIMSRFPHLPETFILREMMAIEKLGWEVALFPLIAQKQLVIHKEAEKWIKNMRKTPWFSLGVLTSNIRLAIKSPKKYFSIFGVIFKENIFNLKFFLRALLIFPKAVFMAEEIKKEKIQHIHAHYATHPALAAWIIHQITGASYSVTVHAHDIFVEKTMLRTKLHYAAFIVAISEYNCDYLARTLGEWVRNKTHIVRCGIDPAYYHCRGTQREKEEYFEIISVGSLHPYKGHVFLVKACAILRNSKIPFRCRIVGGGHLQNWLTKLIREHELDGIVELMGPRTQDEVSRLLETANCYVQPSVIMRSGKMEGIPVALMEAMASEIPVVATAISGIPELVKDGETGWLVPPEDERSLANAILKVFSDPADAHQIAQKGRQLVINEFDLYSNARKLSSLFTQYN